MLKWDLSWVHPPFPPYYSFLGITLSLLFVICRALNIEVLKIWAKPRGPHKNIWGFAMKPECNDEGRRKAWILIFYLLSILADYWCCAKPVLYWNVADVHSFLSFASASFTSVGVVLFTFRDTNDCFQLKAVTDRCMFSFEKTKHTFSRGIRVGKT